MTASDGVSSLLVTRTDGVLQVTIARPERRNALSLEVLRRLGDVFAEASGDEELRLAIITGSGDKAFASGGDLQELMSVRSPTAAREVSELGKRALNAVRRFPTPVVAAVNGVAIGGGAELALACDLRFAAAHAGFGLIHSRLNISPSWGGGVDLMRLVGFVKGLRHLADGAILDSTQALRLGLYDAVAPPEAEFAVELEAFIAALRSRPPQVARALKALSLGERMHGRGELEATETEHFASVWTHPDHWTAVANATAGAKSHVR